MKKKKKKKAVQNPQRRMCMWSSHLSHSHTEKGDYKWVCTPRVPEKLEESMIQTEKLIFKSI